MSNNRDPNYVFLFRVLYFFLFAGMGVRFPFIGPYFREIGLSGTEIGTLGLIQPAIALLTLVPLGWIYDRIGGGGKFPAAMVIIGTATFLAVPYCADFASIFAVMVLLSLVGMAIIPIIDSSAFKHLKDMPTGTSYGSLRVAGTVGFAVSCLALGYAIDREVPQFLEAFPAFSTISPESSGYLLIFPAYALFGLVVAVFLFRLPRTKLKERSTAGLGRLLKNRIFLLFLAAAFFSRLSESAAMRFLSIYFHDLGASAKVISYSWLVSTSAEAVVMILSLRIIKKIGVRKLIALGIAASVIRWGLLGFVSNIPLAIAIQSLHAFTFGAFFIGAITFVDRNAPASRKSSAMMLYWMVPCTAQMIGNQTAGLIYDYLGVHQVFIFCGLAALVGFFVFLPVVFSKENTHGIAGE